MSPRALLGLACAAAFSASALGESLDLSGTWRFRLDPAGAGVAGHWWSEALNGTARLPGSLPSEGIGDPVTVDTQWTGGIVDQSYFTSPEYAPYRQPGNIKVPFWLQPGTHYVGAAWFQREIVIPAGWAGRRLVLSLERPHWKTSLWLDGEAEGSNDSLSVAHTYELGAGVAPGRHVITIRVDNTLAPDIGENSHSVSDHTQGNWNGIVGEIVLRATAGTWVSDLQVYPDAARRRADVRGMVSGSAGSALPRLVRICAGPRDGRAGPPVSATVQPDGSFSAVYELGADAPLWDEFSPGLMRMTASIGAGEGREAVFGLRDVTSRGGRLEINGRPLFLRGTLDCAAYPRTGNPPVDLASWRRILGTIKAHGLNHVRYHSWCPPETAFEAADELGVYMQVEMASWPNQSTSLGDGKPVDAWIDRETTRILAAYGNHPSFALISCCNEPGGERAAAWLSGWITRHRAGDSRRLFTSGSGWPEIPENDYNVSPEPRIQHWGEGLGSRINALPPETRSDYRAVIGRFRAPVVSHEIGQWCAYPNFGEMAKYTGYLKPRNFEIFQASLEAHHMGGQARQFLAASGRLQVLCYKEDIESALRTPGMGGFQLLGLSDFPGQGTALVGVLDAFWEEKGYVSPAQFRRFCASTVPLALLGKRVFTSDESLDCDVEVAHFGPAPLRSARVAWKLVEDGGRQVAGGSFPAADIAVGGPARIGRLAVPLASVGKAARCKLVIGIESTPFENDWDVWVYPPAGSREPEPPSPSLVTRTLDGAALARLESGGSVVWMVPPGRVAPDPVRGDVALGFSSIFWNTAWTKGQAPHTLGILCDPGHPALRGFPTEFCSDWQWWYPIRHAAPMILDGCPAGLRPIVQVIDDWFTNRKLGLVFEARVGRGRILVTSIDLQGADLDPVRRQLRASLLAYAAGPDFRPSTEVTPAQLASLARPE